MKRKILNYLTDQEGETTLVIAWKLSGEDIPHNVSLAFKVQVYRKLKEMETEKLIKNIGTKIPNINNSSKIEMKNMDLSKWVKI